MLDDHEPDPESLLSRWRAARLAAVVFALRRLGHDLRGAFSPALLASERLQAHGDPSVRRAAETMLRCVDRATEALRETVRSVHGGEGARSGGSTRLRDALESHPGLLVQHGVAEDAAVLADAPTLATAIDGVLRHLQGAGATRTACTAEAEAAHWIVAVRHDARPGAARVDAAIPSELSVAREWLRSLGGDLVAGEGELRIVLRRG